MSLAKFLSILIRKFPPFFAWFVPQNFPQHQTSTACFGTCGGSRVTLVLPRSPVRFPTSTPKPRAEGRASASGTQATSRSQLPLRSVLDAPHWGAAPEPAGETSPSLHFRHVMEESPSLPLLYSSLSHPASSASNRYYPLQHPERTRFRLFRPKPGALRSFCPLLTCKIWGLVL